MTCATSPSLISIHSFGSFALRHLTICMFHLYRCTAFDDCCVDAVELVSICLWNSKRADFTHLYVYIHTCKPGRANSICY